VWGVRRSIPPLRQGWTRRCTGLMRKPGLRAVDRPAPGPPDRRTKGHALIEPQVMGGSQEDEHPLAALALGAVAVGGTDPSVRASPDVERPPRSASLIRPSRKRPGEPHLQTGPVESQDGRCRHFVRAAVRGSRVARPGAPRTRGAGAPLSAARERGGRRSAGAASAGCCPVGPFAA
jgi:hypothetical protein